ncbi:MAG: TIGR03087 family PEP-CTERM/XrtA system glycosyltransferase [Chloroflexota bacterium]|nr:TIGR03087 family PEP-CTERM/XrtA system glycosyltransferase [Chloroflexota bacterium]
MTSRLPYPPDRGDRLRAFNFIKQLSGQHEIVLLSFIADEEERDHQSALEAYCKEIQVIPLSAKLSTLGVAANLWRSEPLQALYYRSAAMKGLVNDTLASNPFDAAYIHLFRMAPYLADTPNLYRIVDLTDAISSEILRSLPYRSAISRFVYRVERPRIQRYERFVADSFEETWLISNHDRQLLAAGCPTANIQVIPNGVDLNRLHPIDIPREPSSLVFVGHMGVLHNVDAATYLANEILPGIQEQIPAAKLTIVGADPAPQVQALAANPSVTVTGFVDDLNGYLNRSAVFVAPLRFAAGVQNKVLEAMAAGRPVVTSSMVNGGLEAEAGRDLLVADDIETTVGHIVGLLNDPVARQTMGQAARQFVSQHFSWRHVLDRMDVIEATIMNQEKTP